MSLLAFGTWHYSRKIAYVSYTYLPLMWTVRYHVFQKLNFRKQRLFRLYFLKYSSTHANRRFIFSSFVGGQSWLSSQRIKKLHLIEGYFRILKFHQPLFRYLKRMTYMYHPWPRTMTSSLSLDDSVDTAIVVFLITAFPSQPLKQVTRWWTFWIWAFSLQCLLPVINDKNHFI